MAKYRSPNQKHIPGSSTDSEDIFNFPFTLEDETVDFINDHGRLMFIVRGPPGTAKSTLTTMLMSRYAKSVMCCADKYFSSTFAGERNKETLKESHTFCQRKVKEACINGSHPIIVQNTHMRRFEMQDYVNYAAEYKYTVIMAITTRKFIINPDILAKSNKKGLKKDYFRNRLRQWEEVPPILTGWFLCPDDSSFLLNRAQVSLEALLEDGKFRQKLNVFEKDDVLKYYMARKVLYLVAGGAGLNGMSSSDFSDYYLSDRVQDRYGKCYRISILGYIVTVSDIVAVVYMTEDMKYLIPENSTRNSWRDDDLDEISTRFSSMELNANLLEHIKTEEFDQDFLSSGKTEVLRGWGDMESIDAVNCNYIHLGQRRNQVVKAQREKQEFQNLLSCVTDADGQIHDCKFTQTMLNFKICQLADKGWLVKLPEKIILKSIFTGLYV